MWAVEVMLDGCPIPYEVCRCSTPNAVAAIVLALCHGDGMRPITIRRIEGEAMAPRILPGPWPEEVT